MRVDFKQNRQVRGRADDWTRRYHESTDGLSDTSNSESVRAKGDLSRKRTIVVGAGDAGRMVNESVWRAGVVTVVHGLIATVEDAERRLWQCTVRRVLRTLQIDQRNAVTVGDRVWFAEDPKSGESAPVGVIERVEPRQTTLSRRERRKREHVIVANADQLLIIGSVAQPRLKPHLIDRYIVAAHKGGLQPIIVFSKSDLLESEAGPAVAGAELPDDSIDTEDQLDGETPAAEAAFVEVEEGSPLAVFDELTTLGYRCIWASIETGEGLADVRDALKDHVSVIAGQSGVGKSSLLNAIQPGLRLEVQTVSRDNEKGRHTTTHARLLRLDFGGYVVDTPGIRSFDLWNIDLGELEAYFVEFLPHLQQCRFPDCSHRHEQDCGVRAAYERGEISARRFFSYLKMFSEV